MAIQRYQPSSLLQQFNDEISRMFLGQTDALPSGMSDQWRPAIDIHENDEAYLIDAEVPGVDPAAIEVTLRNGVLTVSGGAQLSLRLVQGKRQRRCAGIR